MFNLGKLGFLLLPFSFLYNAATRLRNHLFNIGYKKSFEFEANVIGVGNLTVGGTGKSPMVEYLVKLLQDRKIATLSRGYGRKTRGFRIATEEDTALTIGDEPLQFFKKFKNISVTVGEERAVAIPHILAELNPEVIILDDAFQHRYVKPSVNIMLTDFTRPFYHDYVMPTGRLREARNGASRADIIVVTKCADDISTNTMDEMETNIREYAPKATICFAGIRYLKPVAFNENTTFGSNVLLFSGIANTRPLIEYVSTHFQLMDEFYFPDHHQYTKRELQTIEERFQRMSVVDKCLLTTEKDIVKLYGPEMEGAIQHLPIYYIPIETYFIRGGNIFDKQILNSIKTYNH